ncbi:response regulator transcription factor [Chryseobacterium sp.]|uniref:response regulator transcription factor n=1 Tax=Chryseobacterium sp. TaxID=1871047 RepID=UPI00388D269A
MLTKTTMMTPNLTIYDGPLLYTQGLLKLLTQEKLFGDINIVDSAEKLYHHISRETPEYILLSSNNLLLTEIYKYVEEIISREEGIKIIIIGNHYDVITIRKLFGKGIKCYLDRDSGYEEFLKAIKTLFSNEIYVCEYAKEMMINFISEEQQKQKYNFKDPLTKREMEILKLICNGFSSKDICQQLFISINTVETHRKRILMKLNVKNSVGVVKYALENNIID